MSAYACGKALLPTRPSVDDLTASNTPPPPPQKPHGNTVFAVGDRPARGKNRYGDVTPRRIDKRLKTMAARRRRTRRSCGSVRAPVTNSASMPLALPSKRNTRVDGVTGFYKIPAQSSSKQHYTTPLVIRTSQTRSDSISAANLTRKSDCAEKSVRQAR